jgi:hypothetical protein
MLITYRHSQTQQFKRVDGDDPNAVSEAESRGYVVYTHDPASMLPEPYAPGVERLYGFQIANKNNPYA